MGLKCTGGCWCKVNINPYARKRKTNQGISVGLNGVQKWRDGDRFGRGSYKVDDMFDSGEDDPVNYQDDPFTDDFEDANTDDDLPY
jgi:Protein of unknown function (DUF2815).